MLVGNPNFEVNAILRNSLALWLAGLLAGLVIAEVPGHSLRVLRLDHRRLAVDEVDSVSVDDAVILAPDSEVVGDEFDRSFERGCHPGLPWAGEHGPILFLSGVLVLM